MDFFARLDSACFYGVVFQYRPIVPLTPFFRGKARDFARYNSFGLNR